MTKAYFFICPRGFANEVRYYSVDASRTAEIEAHFEDRKDREFDAGNTGWDWGWTTSAKAKAPGVAIDWDKASRVPAWAMDY